MLGIGRRDFITLLGGAAVVAARGATQAYVDAGDRVSPYAVSQAVLTFRPTRFATDW